MKRTDKKKLVLATSNLRPLTIVTLEQLQQVIGASGCVPCGGNSETCTNLK